MEPGDPRKKNFHVSAREKEKTEDSIELTIPNSSFTEYDKFLLRSLIEALYPTEFIDVEYSEDDSSVTIEGDRFHINRVKNIFLNKEWDTNKDLLHRLQQEMLRLDSVQARMFFRDTIAKKDSE